MVRANAAAASAGGADGSFGKATSFQAAFWKFLRPHTIRGTILGTTAVVSKALMENQQAIDWGLLPRALMGLVALLCGNGYIVGINQIYDVSIDVVNKPFLPVAAGGFVWVVIPSQNMHHAQPFSTKGRWVFVYRCRVMDSPVRSLLLIACNGNTNYDNIKRTIITGYLLSFIVWIACSCS